MKRTLFFALALALAACGDDASNNGSNNGTPADAGNNGTSNNAADAGNNGTSGANNQTTVEWGTPAADCDSLDESYCALPWPSSLYIADAPDMPTGRALAFGATTLPANGQGKNMDAEPYLMFDGYGFGTPIMTVFPGVDLTGLASEQDIAPSMASDSKTLLFKVTDGGLEQVPHWVELDGFEDDPAKQILFMRQAVILDASSRYIVAFRDLTTGDGTPIEPSAAFAALRDGTAGDDPAVESRRERFEEIFGLLEAEGVERESLTLAWDFETASEENLHRFADEATALALAEVQENGPSFEFTEVVEFGKAADSGNQSDVTAYEISGTMMTPSVLDDQVADNRLAFDGSAVRLVDAVPAPIHITVPHRAADGETVGVILYGHGMLGSSQEVFAGHLQELAETLGYVLIGVDFRGMSSDDVGGVIAAMFDMSRIRHLTEGTVQGIAQTHVLAHAASTSLEPALQAVDPDITLNDDIQWFGASQGGIYGGSIMATSPVFERGVLAVPGNNYATLLSRSVNFEPFFQQLQTAYGEFGKIHIVVAATQLLWDVSDPITFWRRLAQDPGPQGKRDSLLLVSKGDKQVAVVTNEILARTYSEVPLMANYDTERIPYGVELQAYPHQGSGQILFDFGNPWPFAEGNTPPDNELRDPHSRIAEVSAVAQLLEAFLADSTIIDICGGDGCTPE